MQKNLLEKLNDYKGVGFLGFDGFIDELCTVVDTRQDTDNFTSVNQIADFALTIAGAAGKSANIELMPKLVKAGGNGPLMGGSLQKLGVDFAYAGALGKNEIHPLFADFAENCSEYHSICEPARCQALEFNDGKIMLGQLDELNKINRDNLSKIIKAQIEQADFFCFLNWTELPEMNGVYECFLQGLDESSNNLRRPFFADLADFRRRSVEDIDQVLALLKGISSHLDVYLGLNQSEARQMCTHLGLNGEVELLSDLASQLQSQLALKEICVHSHHEVVSHSNQAAGLQTLYIPEPKISTGAGDHFNAGYFRAILSGLDQQSCLEFGILNSAYYVSTGETGTLENLKSFLEDRSQAH